MMVYAFSGNQTCEKTFFPPYLFALDQRSRLCNITTGNYNPKAKESVQTTHFLSHCPVMKYQICAPPFFLIYCFLFNPIETPLTERMHKFPFLYLWK